MIFVVLCGSKKTLSIFSLRSLEVPRGEGVSKAEI